MELMGMTLQQRIAAVQQKIEEAAQAAGRNPAEITLCAATKVQTSETIRQAIAAGITTCGENRVQELTGHLEDNAYEGAKVHFIGHLQRNKVKYVVGHVDLIQSVDGEELLGMIEKQAAKLDLIQNILIEVNIGGEESKSGVSPEQAHRLAEMAGQMEHVCLRGLMAIPPVADEKTKNSNYFTEMRQVFIDILTKKYDNVDMDYLSMGMTNDFETAIACGANMVRVGTAIFGKRPYQIVSP